MKKAPPPSHFINRELGILAFNRRVLAQAVDEAVPLLERLRFITIVSSNLDEFFEIRIAGLKEQIKLGLPEPGPDGRGPAEVFAATGRVSAHPGLHPGLCCVGLSALKTRVSGPKAHDHLARGNAPGRRPARTRQAAPAGASIASWAASR